MTEDTNEKIRRLDDKQGKLIESLKLDFQAYIQDLLDPPKPAKTSVATTGR